MATTSFCVLFMADLFLERSSQSHGLSFRQRRRLACRFHLSARLDEFHAEVDLHQFFQIAGGTLRIRAAEDANDVARDLDRRQDQPPRETPPTEEQGKESAANLSLRGARTAGDLLCISPLSQ